VGKRALQSLALSTNYPPACPPFFGITMEDILELATKWWASGQIESLVWGKLILFWSPKLQL